MGHIGWNSKFVDIFSEGSMMDWEMIFDRFFSFFRVLLSSNKENTRHCHGLALRRNGVVTHYSKKQHIGFTCTLLFFHHFSIFYVPIYVFPFRWLSRANLKVFSCFIRSTSTLKQSSIPKLGTIKQTSHKSWRQQVGMYFSYKVICIQSNLD